MSHGSVRTDYEQSTVTTDRAGVWNVEYASNESRWTEWKDNEPPTLRAPLSGTFLQTLPDLVTPLKGHSFFISAQLSSDAVSALRKVRVLIKDCGSNLAPKHPRKHEAHPPRVKKREEFRLDSNDCSFICAGVNFVGGYK